MALRQIGNPFRTAYNQFNLIDPFEGGTALKSTYSSGATTIDAVPLGAGISSKWKLLSMSVQAYMALIDAGSQSTTTGAFGKFGRASASLILQPNFDQTNSPPYGGMISPMLPLPQDSTLTATLWDPATNPLPPRTPSPPLIPPDITSRPPSALLPVNTSIQLPVPIPIDLVERLLVGLWLTPSLIGFYKPAVNAGLFCQFGLAILYASYVLNFDDAA